MRLRNIITNIADGIITLNQRGEIESLSPVAEHMFGYLEKQVQGRSLNQLLAEGKSITELLSDETISAGHRVEVVGLGVMVRKSLWKWRLRRCQPLGSYFIPVSCVIFCASAN